MKATVTLTIFLRFGFRFAGGFRTVGYQAGDQRDDKVLAAVLSAQPRRDELLDLGVAVLVKVLVAAGGLQDAFGQRDGPPRS
ncbi:hypothetical protein [Acrocarpospora sp. B8E8]|uniref:hypothetical protein n=1 Tax=Acrocarpospora sp. B8E8 TaxID=3153572 RepID=UPI00325C3C9A